MLSWINQGHKAKLVLFCSYKAFTKTKALQSKHINQIYRTKIPDEQSIMKNLTLCMCPFEKLYIIKKPEQIRWQQLYARKGTDFRLSSFKAGLNKFRGYLILPECRACTFAVQQSAGQTDPWIVSGVLLSRKKWCRNSNLLMTADYER